MSASQTILPPLRIGLLATSLLLTGCSTAQAPPKADDGVPLFPGNTPVEHAVHSTDLRGVMYELEDLTLEQLPGELGVDSARQVRLDEIRELAGRLAEAAAAIPDVFDLANLPSEDARQFRELSDRLQRDAVALRDRANRGEVFSMHDETEAILATCNTCHAKFRALPATKSPPGANGS
jgi:hypothetical protein